MLQLLLAALLLPLAQPAKGEPRLTGGVDSIPRNLVAGGGGQMSSAGYALTDAVGEGAISTFTVASNNLEAGLMPMIAQPGTITALTLVTKDTGSVELSWTSPGLDGFIGGVVNGYYRVDFTSDPAHHVFDPTVYQTQIATTVSPGDQQFYTLTGLLPNTTYFARVYLADARLSVAETSPEDDDSTLAYPPAAPVITGVFSTSVTFSWSLPAPGGAEGFRADSSSTDFGALYPGGVVTSSMTGNGTTISLTVVGLTPHITYYFKLASLNWQGDTNFTSILSTLTLPGGPVPITSLALAGDALGRTVTLSWNNPVFANPAGVTILVSSSPITTSLVDGAAYPPGTAFGDGSVVGSSAPTPTATYLQGGLKLNTTAYFALYSRDVANTFSVSVSTYIVLNLPPMAAPGLSEQLSADGSSVTLNWWQVTSFLDGTSFNRPFNPISWELDRYDVWRATGIVHSTWTLVASTAAAASSAITALPAVGGLYYYKVVSRNAFNGSGADAGMVIDTLGNLYVVDDDGVTRLQIPPFAASVVQPSGNPTGRPLLIRSVDRPQDLGGTVVRSLEFTPYVSPTDVATFLPNAASPSFNIVLGYQTAGGVVVPSGLGAAGAKALSPGVMAVNASNTLSAYVVGADASATKIFGAVDAVDQTVNVQTGMMGNYQIRTIAQTQSFAFDLSGVSNKVITPNGDGINDTVVFTFDNPLGSAVLGKIYDIRGGFVADLAPGPIAGSSLKWDGRAGNGGVVSQGVYIYQIRAEGKTFTGTVVVVR